MSEKIGRILCVDDEPHVLRALKWLLQRDFEVHTAGSAREGLELVRSIDFDVVVSDQRMPEVTGVEFLEKVRESSPRAMRILLTGYTDLDAMVRSVNESEVFRFITKPWDIKEFPRLIAEAARIARSGAEAHATASQPALSAAAQQVTTVALRDAESILLVDDNPEIHASVDEACGDALRVRHAYNLADAVRMLKERTFGVIISEVQVGQLDATRLLRLMKIKHPETVSVVFSDQRDAEVVMTLINHGQVYRFIPKPFKTGFIRIVLNAAIKRHRELAGNPGLQQRYKAESVMPEVAESLIRDIQQATASLVPRPVAAGAGPSGQGESGFAARVRAGIRRLFNG